MNGEGGWEMLKYKARLLSSANNMEGFCVSRQRRESQWCESIRVSDG